jgi:ribosome-binding factor A
VSEAEAEQRFFFDLEAVRSDVRVRSLCRQVQEALSLALDDLVDGPWLEGAWLAAVEPAPGPARLRATVVLPPHAAPEALEAAFTALRDRTPHLRAEVAQAIHRKRVPDLVFCVVLDGGGPRGA